MQCSEIRQSLSSPSPLCCVVSNCTGRETWVKIRLLLGEEYTGFSLIIYKSLRVLQDIIKKTLKGDHAFNCFGDSFVLCHISQLTNLETPSTSHPHYLKKQYHSNNWLIFYNQFDQCINQGLCVQTCVLLKRFEAESFSLKYQHLTFKCKIHSVEVDLYYLQVSIN